MNTGGGQTTQTVQQNSAPWQPAQPYLQDLFGQAQNTYLNAQGNANSYPLDVAPFSSTTQNALNLTAQRALNGSPIVGAADNALTNILNGQTAPGTSTLQQLAKNGYTDQGLALTNAGAQANPYATQAASILGQNNGPNPYLNAMFQAESQPVTDAVNAQFEKGNRSGSGANQQELTRNLGQLAAQVYGNNFVQEQQLGQNAANALAGIGQNQQANLLNAGNSLSNAYANQAQVEGNAANSLNNAFNTQNQQAVSASAFAVPQLANQDYANLQNLLSVGQTYDTQNQNLLNNNLAAWSYAQQQPWNILNDYSGVLTGLGSLGGTKSGTQTTQQPGQSLFPSLIGGAIQALPFLMS